MGSMKTMPEKSTPKKAHEGINTVFNLVSSVNNHILHGALETAMKDLVKALKLYLRVQVIKKEKDLLEDQFYDLELKISNHPKFVATYGPVSFAKGEHKRAIDFLGQLINVEPDSVKEKMERFQKFLDSESLDEAKVLVREIMIDPDIELKHLVTIGDSYLNANMWKEAQDIYRSINKKSPNSIHFLNRMAMSLRKNGQFEEALAYYQKVARQAPLDEGVYYNIAVAYVEWGKLKKAARALDMALEINPDFEKAQELKTNLKHDSQSKMA